MDHKKTNVEVLKGNAEIRNAVRDLVTSSAREIVIIVAFVGSGASKYILPSNAKRSPKSIRLICWDKEGCTSPEEIQHLQKKDVHVEFANNLHMKLYWAKDGHAVLGSANLSDNGLGRAGLHELAVRIPASSVDIDMLIRQVQPERVDDERLKQLFERTVSFRRRNNGKDVLDSTAKAGDQKRRRKTFGEWWSAGAMPEWKFFAWHEDYGKTPGPVKELGVNKLFRSGPEWYTRENEVVLSIDLKRRNVSWDVCDRQVPMKKGDENYSPEDWETHYAVQFEKTRVSEEPFRLNRRFKEALSQYLKQENIKTFQDCVMFTKKNHGSLSKEQLRNLAKIYDKQRRTSQTVRGRNVAR